MKYQFLSKHKVTFTESGRYTLVVAFLMAIVGFLLQSNLLYLIFSGLGALILTDLLFSFFCFKGLKVSRFCPTHALRGENFTMRLRVENTSYTKFFLNVTDFGFTENMPKERLGIIPKIGKEESVTLSYVKHVKARGTYFINNTLIESAFPFGFWKVERVFTAQSKIIIYPEFYETPQFAVSYRGIRAEFANTSSNRPGTGGDFFEIREYQYGDSLKNIHWKATAKAGKLMVKQLEKFTLSNLSIILDNSSGLVLGLGEESNFEYAIKTVATIANKALSRRYHVKLIYYDLENQKIDSVKAYGRMTPILNALAGVDITEKTHAEDLIEASIPEIEKDSIAVFVLLSLSSEATKRIMNLAMRGVECVLILFDPKSFAAVLDQKIGDFYSVFSNLINKEASYLTGEGARVYIINQGDYIPEALSRPRMFVNF